MDKLSVEATKIFCAILKKLGNKTEMQLKVSGMMDLVVKQLDGHIETAWGAGRLCSLSHFYIKNGDVMRDPEMEFIVVDNRVAQEDYLLIGIYPTMYLQHDLGLEEESVEIKDGNVTGYKKAWQAAHCRFANKWMQDIRRHQYLK